MVLLRPRLRCHYCGERCHVKRKEEKRRFKCEHCLAVNFLDENGEVADVPPEEAADPENILNETDSSAGSRFESSIFCQTCVKNQLYFNKTLSEYLPDLEDPEYPKYEAALPDFRRKLEDRYPQVCARCEPRVRQQLQQATYTAKSDHVRRMLAKSRERRIASRLGWRSLVLTLGGVGYWASVAGQLLWHAMGALSSDRIAIGEPHPGLCVQDLVIHHTSTQNCADIFGILASHALKLGILSIWWNPKWQHKLAELEGRLVNLDTYYQAQAGIIIFRSVLWSVLQSSMLSLGLSELPKALHGVSLVLLLILTIWSNSLIIQIDITPLVDWTQEIGPLLSDGQFVPPQAPPQQIFSPPNSQYATSQSQQFAIGSLGPASTSRYAAWRPPTPPTDDPDAMDWEPLNSQFTAQPKKPILKQAQPSPFHGTLPALHLRGVQYAKTAQQIEHREAMGIPPGFFDSGRRPTSQHDQRSTEPGFAEPTFFPHQDKNALGLEKIFDDVFKLRDDTVIPQPPSNASQQQEVGPALFSTSPAVQMPQEASAKTERWTLSRTLAAASFPALCASLLIWIGEDFGFYAPQQIKMYTGSLAAVVALLRLLLKTTKVMDLSEHWGAQENFGCLLSLGEVGIFTALSLYRWSYGCGSRGSAGQLDPLLYCGMIWQEFFYFKVANDTAAPGTVLAYEPQSNIDSGSRAAKSSPNPSEATTVQQTGFGRPRGNSIDSETSSRSATSTTSTAPGWKTPKINPRRAPSSVGGPSPGFGLGNLMLDDLTSSTGSGMSVAGPRLRGVRGRVR